MDRVKRLVEQYFEDAGGEIRVGGLLVSSLAERYGTPLFIYDRATMEKKLECLRDALPPEFSISYSVKANPAKEILEFFLERGCGLEIASAGELYRALDAGCPPDRIVFAGPGKTREELELALTKGVSEIHVESATEIERLIRLARKAGVRARIALRINPGGQSQGGAMRMGGKPAPFGIDEETLDEFIDWVGDEPSLDLCGIHLFLGTQILDATILVNQYQRGLEIACRMASRLHRSLQTIDFGGGFGIPYFPGEQELDIRQLREGLARLLVRYSNDSLLVGTRLMVEPGRYLVGESGIYVARINDIKTSRGKKFWILDGGMNHHLAASGNLGQVIKKNFPIAVVNRFGDPPSETVDIVGPLCTPLDTLGREVRVPRAKVGDVVGIFQSGAYARTASPVDFLSHPRPPEILVVAGNDLVICQRGYR